MKKHFSNIILELTKEKIGSSYSYYISDIETAYCYNLSILVVLLSFSLSFFYGWNWTEVVINGHTTFFMGD